MEQDCSLSVIEMEISDQELATILFAKALRLCGNPDDGGMAKLVTDDRGNTYFDWGNVEGLRIISADPKVAALCDAARFLCGDNPQQFKLKTSP